ncbi:hypothetical protein GYMLUDRAFT_64049 [Collybiopsis luxurians FD-317 M1]|uniref:Uncharacterized protein n=1 Tax=Collybiopsis luxurians FD-317 M1 TaxID=944289 RepID=A0A0D0BT58_9AGAR|nr:hypothetical protein GYMLUDRAFT_64049 [Collybiopsis luxurians FD-317 M1]
MVNDMISKIKSGGASRISTKHILDGIGSTVSSGTRSKVRNTNSDLNSARAEAVKDFRRTSKAGNELVKIGSLYLFPVGTDRKVTITVKGGKYVPRKPVNLNLNGVYDLIVRGLAIVANERQSLAIDPNWTSDQAAVALAESQRISLLLALAQVENEDIQVDRKGKGKAKKTAAEEDKDSASDEEEEEGAEDEEEDNSDLEDVLLAKRKLTQKRPRLAIETDEEPDEGDTDESDDRQGTSFPVRLSGSEDEHPLFQDLDAQSDSNDSSLAAQDKVWTGIFPSIVSVSSQALGFLSFILENSFSFFELGAPYSPETLDKLDPWWLG